MPASTSINRKQLFVASCMSLLVTSLSFGIRAGILTKLGIQYHLDGQQLANIAATAFWGFPVAVVIGGMIVDIIGMKRLLQLAFLFHLAGIALTVFAQSYMGLFLSTLLIGIANGTVEAACNPLVATIFPENKTTKLNHFHLWFPGGIVIGTLLVYFLDKVGASWQLEVGLMFIPTILYGILFSRLSFPVTERVASGVTTAQMYKAVLSPLFIFMIICMFGTAITELFTNQWTDVIFKTVTSSSLLILTLVAGLQTLGRAFAGPIVHKLNTTGVLLISAILSALGMYLMGHMQGTGIWIGAVSFGIGVAFFWPCMIGFVAENLPRTGAVGLNFMGGAGMFAVSVYMMFMGGYYDKLMSQHLPVGASLDAYRSADPASDLGKAYDAARSATGPDVLNVTLIIPVILTAAFIGLYFYMKSKHKPQLLPTGQPVANAYDNL